MTTWRHIIGALFFALLSACSGYLPSEIPSLDDDEILVEEELIEEEGADSSPAMRVFEGPEGT